MGAAGDKEPATKSRASVSPQLKKRDQGYGAEHGRPSAIPRQRKPAERRPPPNVVRASPERSDTKPPVNPPQAEPSPRAKRAVGEGRRLDST